jgi:hypothetical protein
MKKERLSIESIYTGMIDRFKDDGARIINIFKPQHVERWTKPVGRGRRISLDLDLMRGSIILSRDKKVVGLALGRIGSNKFNTLEFGVLSENNAGGLLNNRVESLERLIHQDNEGWGVGSFVDDSDGIRPRCWANNGSLGGKDFKFIDNVDLAYDMVVRTIKYVEEE